MEQEYPKRTVLSTFPRSQNYLYDSPTKLYQDVDIIPSRNHTKTSTTTKTNFWKKQEARNPIKLSSKEGIVTSLSGWKLSFMYICMWIGILLWLFPVFYISKPKKKTKKERYVVRENLHYLLSLYYSSLTKYD